MGVEQNDGNGRWRLVWRNFKPTQLDSRTPWSSSARRLEGDGKLLTRFDELSETFFEIGVSGFLCGLHMRQTSLRKSHVLQHVHGLSDQGCTG